MDNSLPDGASGGISGIGHGGRQAIKGAAVYAFAAGKTGYGSPAELIAPVTTTDTNGFFSFPTTGANKIVCPGTSDPNYSNILYIVLSGGNPGVAGGNTVANADAVLLAVLGDCTAAVTSQAFVVVNEVTTFASMTAMQQFYNPSTFSGSLAEGTSENFGTSTRNVAGLTYATAGVANLVNLSTGQAGATINPQVPNAKSGASAAGMAVTVTPEISKINLAANVLATCVNSNPNNNTTCGSLFSLLTTNTITDTMQAAYYMAKNPTSMVSGTSNIRTIVNNVTGMAPFSPTLAVSGSSYPNDWTIAVTYGSSTYTTVTGGTGKVYFFQEPGQIAVDGNGLIWVENAYTSSAITVGNSISQIDPTGVPMQAALTGIDGLILDAPYDIVIDPHNNVYVSNYGNTTSAPGATVTEYPYCASPCANTATSTSTMKTFNTGLHPGVMASDGAGNIFVADTGTNSGANDLEEITSTNTTGSAAVLFTGISSTQTYFNQMTVDSSFNVYLGSNAASVYKFLKSNSYSALGTYTGSSLTGGNATGLATDSSNDVYVSSSVADGGFFQIPVGTPIGATATGTVFGNSDATNGGCSAPEHIILDGAGDIWGTNNATPGGVCEFSTAGAAISPSGTSPAVGFGSMAGTLLPPRNYLGSNVPAIDLSGNVWIGAASGGAGTSAIVEIVGAATPVITPIAAGLPTTAGGTNKLATRP